VLENLVDNSDTTSFGEDKVLIGVELEKDIRLVVVNELHAALFEVAGGDGGFLTELLAVVLVGDAVAHAAHFFDPVLV
jgi:hypothetical protein